MSKNKIAKVITSCNECEHKRELIECGGNTYYAAVCDFSESSGDNEPKPFLIMYGYDKPSRYDLGIPDNCPLEDYTKKE